MTTFKEFLAYDEDYEVFSSLTEGEVLDALLAAPKFVSGVAGNIVGQSARGVGNVGYGLAKGSYGLAKSGIGALQYMGGNREARKKAAEKFKSGLGIAAQGLGDVAKGAVQVGAIPVTALLRGAQAVDDKSISGVLAPGDPDRTSYQALFGLGSGNQAKPSKKTPESVVQQKPSLPSKVVPRGANKDAAIPQGYYDLVDKLRRASSRKEGVALTAEIAKRFPQQYAAARQRAMQLSRRRPSTNPSGRLRSGAGRPKPSGFGL